MTMASHLVELRRKHENLAEMVEQAQRSPGVDDLKIAELKKQKLKLKEEITRLSATLVLFGAGARPAPPPGDQNRRDPDCRRKAS
jgi:hypothetical protein